MKICLTTCNSTAPLMNGFSLSITLEGKKLNFSSSEKGGVGAFSFMAYLGSDRHSHFLKLSYHYLFILTSLSPGTILCSGSLRD